MLFAVSDTREKHYALRYEPHYDFSGPPVLVSEEQSYKTLYDRVLRCKTIRDATAILENGPYNIRN